MVPVRSCRRPQDERGSCLCWRVDLRREEDRLVIADAEDGGARSTGLRGGDEMVAEAGVGVVDVGGVFCSRLESSWISKDERGVDVTLGEAKSNTLKSLPRLEMPCKLRRLATGLPMLAWSRFMMASLRFRGLEIVDARASVRASPDRSRCTL